MSYNDLDKQERIAYEWQMGMMGGFFKTIMDACSIADLTNQAKLELAFPDHVQAYRKFSTESGWWQNIEKVVGGGRLTPSAWCKQFNLFIHDIDGWRADGKDWNDPITEAEFRKRAEESTCSGNLSYFRA